MFQVLYEWRTWDTGKPKKGIPGAIESTGVHIPTKGEPCPRCRELEGKKRTMNEWSKLRCLPPLHPGCRCYLVPVPGVSDEKPAEGIEPITLSEEYLLDEQHVRINLAEVTTSPAGGGFDALLISAGEGNGWAFSPDVLMSSVQLWEGAKCFIDHSWEKHSLRDLAGVFEGARWDDGRQGVAAKLRLVGPAAPLARDLGEAMLGDGTKPNVGFSADVVFSAVDRKVSKILKVLSVDVVLDPARGGKFLAKFSQNGGITMEENLNVQPLPEGEGAGELRRQLESDRKAVEVLMSKQKEAQALAEEAEKARAVRVAMCQHLLDTGLTASKLPKPAAENVRKQFEGKLFEPAELDKAIEDARQLVSELTGGLVVSGPGRISGMFSSEDQVTAAVYDLLEAERPEGLEKVKAQKLSGIREMYTLMTGDHEFHGGFYPDRVQFAVTTDLPGVLKNALNKIIVMQWQELGRAGYRWWEKIVKVEHMNSLHDVTGILVGEVTLLPTVAEGVDYTSLAVKDSPETASFVKYGGYIGLTLEMFERDETHKLRDYPRKLASAGLRRISSLVSEVFTANTGVGPAMADTYKVFDASHHGNLLTAALASDKFEIASAAIYNQAMLVGTAGTAPKLGLDAKYLLVPRALRLTAMRILYPSFEREATIFSENQQRGEMGDVVTVPEWTDANNWACVADPRLAPGIVVAERFGLMPEIILASDQTNHAVFMADEVRMKARQFVAVSVVDYRPLHKSNVTD